MIRQSSGGWARKIYFGGTRTCMLLVAFQDQRPAYHLPLGHDLCRNWLAAQVLFVTCSLSGN